MVFFFSSSLFCRPKKTLRVSRDALKALHTFLPPPLHGNKFQVSLSIYIAAKKKGRREEGGRNGGGGDGRTNFSRWKVALIVGKRGRRVEERRQMSERDCTRNNGKGGPS